MPGTVTTGSGVAADEPLEPVLPEPLVLEVPVVPVLPLVAKPLLPDPALPLEGMTSISSGSLPRLTEIVWWYWRRW